MIRCRKHLALGYTRLNAGFPLRKSESGVRALHVFCWTQRNYNRFSSSRHRVSGSLSFHSHLRDKPYWTIQSNITPSEVPVVSCVIQNLNNVLNKDNFDLRVICSASTREFCRQESTAFLFEQLVHV